jgi:hypothetical protein
VARVTSELHNDATADAGQAPSDEPTWVAAGAPDTVAEATPDERRAVDAAVEKDTSQAPPTETPVPVDETAADGEGRRPQRVSAPSRLRLLDRLAGLSRTS